VLINSGESQLIISRVSGRGAIHLSEERKGLSTQFDLWIAIASVILRANYGWNDTPKSCQPRSQKIHFLAASTLHIRVSTPHAALTMRRPRHLTSERRSDEGVRVLLDILISEHGVVLVIVLGRDVRLMRPREGLAHPQSPTDDSVMEKHHSVRNAAVFQRGAIAIDSVTNWADVPDREPHALEPEVFGIRFGGIQLAIAETNSGNAVNYGREDIVSECRMRYFTD
jgi:hypothetical protein